MPYFTICFETSTNEDWIERFALSDGEAALDLTGATFALRVAGPAGTVLDVTTANSLMSLGVAGTGEFAFAVPKATMGAIAPGLYSVDCVLALAGQSFTLFSGKLALQQGLAA